MRLGICGYFTAYIIANFVTAIYAFIVGDVIHIFANFKIDKKLAIAMLKYSIVLIPNTFMWWIMNSSDRLMVTSMIGIAANGIYAVAYKIPSLVSTLTGIFNQAWSYSAIREDGAEDEQSYNNRVFIQLVSVVILLSIALLTVIKPFLKLYVGVNYYDAWHYIPFLIVGSAYLTMATFMATSYTVHKDSFGYLFSASFGAILNIILNFALIPLIGVYGAAFATCVSYIAVFLFRLIHTRKYIKYEVENKEFVVGSILLILSSVALFLNNSFGIVIQIIVFAIAIWLYSNAWMPLVHMVVKKIVRR
jgi:O-antigen/teichoic acid export membrane protein